MKLSITLDSNTFSAEGDFTLDANVAALFRQWLNAQGDETGATLEQLTETLDQNTTRLETAVAASTPAPQP